MLRRFLNFRRPLHYSAPIVSEEVQHAVKNNIPVVSLESTIITHGLPYPQNLELANEVEHVIRDQSAIPATIAFINGSPKVGLSTEDLRVLADPASSGLPKHKTSRRDIPYVMARGLTGGTTIASTMMLSKMAGIKVFATGGLGGVHRNGEVTMDVSADLEELSRTDVAVVCSGPKSILDVPRTMEYLETKGVPVCTFNDGNAPFGKHVPGFYTRSSNVASPFEFSSPKEAASMIFAGLNMGLDNGQLFCIPPPLESALDLNFVNSIIEDALQEARVLEISGKNVTPFLLDKIYHKTNGKSVECNAQFVLNNAKIASQIATELASLTKNESSIPNKNKVKFNPSLNTPKVPQKVEAVIVGSIAHDTMCSLQSGYIANDSNPGTHAQSIGGVGFNVALATHMASRDHGSFVETRLCSAVGNDLLGRGLMETMKSCGMATDAVSISENFPTGTYVSIHDHSGALVVASADMKVVENISIEHAMKCVGKYQPRWVLLDCNLSNSLIDSIVKLEDFDVVIEPTSAIKAAKLGKLNNLRIFPHNSVKLITPTVTELNAIFNEFHDNCLFDAYQNEWFPVVDSLGLDYNVRHALDREFERNDYLRPLLEQGFLTKTFRLLPFFSNIIVKDGKNGIIVFQIITDCDKYDNLIKGSKIIDSVSTFSFLTKGKPVGVGRIGVLVQHFPVLDVVPSDEIINVTGAGDSLLGYLFSKLSADSSWLTRLDSTRESYLINSMKSSAASLKSNQAINIDQIRQIP